MDSTHLRLARLRARDHRCRDDRGVDTARLVHERDEQVGAVIDRRYRAPRRHDPGRHVGLRRRDPQSVRRGLRGRRVRPGAQGALPHCRVRGRPVVDELHRRRRLLGGRVLPTDPVLGPRHDGDGVGARPGDDLRGPRTAVDSGVHAGRMAQARPQEHRSRVEVLPHGGVRLGDHALRHVAAVRVQR